MINLHSNIHELNMQKAIALAQKAATVDEVPIGAVILKGSTIIGRGYNQIECLKDPTAHAEILALTSACNTLGNQRLTDCDLYVTKEPCIMCSGAIVNAKIRNLYFGAYDPDFGGCSSLYNLCNDPCQTHRCGVKGGILEHDCRALLDTFFAGIRLKD